MHRPRKLSCLLISLLFLVMLFSGCAKRANLPKQKNLDGGGTIIGNPGPYSPSPDRTPPDSEDMQRIQASAFTLLNWLLNGVCTIVSLKVPIPPANITAGDDMTNAVVYPNLKDDGPTHDDETETANTH